MHTFRRSVVTHARARALVPLESDQQPLLTSWKERDLIGDRKCTSYKFQTHHFMEYKD